MVDVSGNKGKHFKGNISEETREHLRSARLEFRKSMEGILPPGFIEHHRKARKEMLLAWRSMIDASLEHMEEPKAKSK